MTSKQHALQELRRRVEVAASGAPVERLAANELSRLVQALRMYQFELEAQNDELQRAQLELQEARDRYFELYALAPMGYLTLGEQGRILEANHAAAALLQWERPALLGCALSMFMSEADADRFHLHRRDVAGGRAGKHRLEVSLRRADGRWLPVLLESVAASTAGEAHCRTALVDLTDKRQAEESLKDRETRLRAILDPVVDGILTVAADGTIESCNSAALRMFGYAARELEGKPLAAVLPAEAGIVGTLREVLGRRQNGTEFPVEVSVSQLGSEEPMRLVAILRDATERKRKEEALRQAQRMDAVGTLASGIAHDFNNLLMGIAGAGYQALRGLDPEHPSYAAVSRSIEATMRGASLTRQLLSFGDERRGSAGLIELDAVVAGATDLIGRLVGDHIRISVATAAPGRMVLADPGDIEQILMNLASNARDAMPDGGALTIRTLVLESASRDDEPEIALSVQDTGVGMDPETAARMFEPFLTTKETGKGTGLGLSTVFAVAKRLGGTLGAESEIGRGTKLTLRLRVSGRPAMAEVVTLASPLSRGTERVLVVDDDPLVRAAVESHLQSLGYVATMASGPEEAIALFEQRGADFDVLLTDLMMPGMLGGELARELRTRRPGLRTLFMSAHASEEVLGLGPDEPLLNKPFNAQSLGLALRRLFDQPGPSSLPRDLRVLVIDDNHALAETLGEVFGDHSSQVAVTYSGERALEIAEVLLPEVVVCDIDLGHGISGYDVAEALRRNPRLDRVYLIALTGLHVNECRARARAAGFDEILTKPIELEKLFELIAQRAQSQRH